MSNQTDPILDAPHLHIGSSGNSRLMLSSIGAELLGAPPCPLKPEPARVSVVESFLTGDSILGLLESQEILRLAHSEDHPGYFELSLSDGFGTGWMERLYLKPDQLARFIRELQTLACSSPPTSHDS